MAKTAIKRQKNTQKQPRIRDKEQRRRELIDATLASIAKNGISGTTMATITKTAGLSVGLVNLHFSTKETLLEETLQFIAEEHRDYWRKSYDKAELTLQSKLLAIVDAHYHPSSANRNKLAVWFAFYGEASNRAKYRKIMREMDPERWELTRGLLQQIIVDGGYEWVSAEEVAKTLEALFDGFSLNTLLYPDVFDREGAKRNIRTYLAAIFPQHFERPAEV